MESKVGVLRSSVCRHDQSARQRSATTGPLFSTGPGEHRERRREPDSVAAADGQAVVQGVVASGHADEVGAIVVDQIREIERADGAVLRVETTGGGAPVVLLHGTMAGRSTFAKLRTHLSDTHQLVLPVGRDHEGTPASFPDDYGLGSTEVSDLEAVLDELELTEVDIVGHSTGGAIGLAFALKFPDRVRRLVMIEPTVLSLLPPEVAAELRSAAETTATLAEQGDHRAAVASVLEVNGGEGWTNLPDSVKDKTLDAMAPVAEVAGPHSRALADLSVTDQQVIDLSTPALLIYGRESTIFFEAHIAARFAELRPDIEQIMVDGAGHNSHLERHEFVGPRIAAFLTGSDT